MYHTYLYVKQHNITGLKYFGKTISKDPYNYKGSGTYWTRHLKKHGSDISTINIWEFFDQEECKSFATTFSIENNIVESKEWANLAPENGTDGGPRLNSAFKEYNKLPKSIEMKAAWSQTRKGKATRQCPVEIKGITYPSIQNAAKQLDLSEQTIHLWTKNGKAKRLPTTFQRIKTA